MYLSPSCEFVSPLIIIIFSSVQGLLSLPNGSSLFLFSSLVHVSSLSLFLLSLFLSSLLVSVLFFHKLTNSSKEVFMADNMVVCSSITFCRLLKALVFFSISWRIPELSLLGLLSPVELTGAGDSTICSVLIADYV